jgi:hypothetical protein
MNVYVWAGGSLWLRASSVSLEKLKLLPQNYGGDCRSLCWQRFFEKKIFRLCWDFVTHLGLVSEITLLFPLRHKEHRAERPHAVRLHCVLLPALV